MPLHEKLAGVVRFDGLLAYPKTKEEKTLHVGELWTINSAKPAFTGKVYILGFTKTLQSTLGFQKGFMVSLIIIFYSFHCTSLKFVYFSFFLQVLTFCPDDVDGRIRPFTVTKFKDRLPAMQNDGSLVEGQTCLTNFVSIRIQAYSQLFFYCYIKHR